MMNMYDGKEEIVEIRETRGKLCGLQITNGRSERNVFQWPRFTNIRNEGNTLPMADIRKAAWALVRPASTATGGRWWNGMNRPEINCY